MEYRLLGKSGFKVPILSFGTTNFSDIKDPMRGNITEVSEACHLINICLEAGITMFDTADSYSNGSAETMLSKAIKGKRDQVILSTKSGFRMGNNPNDIGSSRFHLIRSVENALKRLNTDYIDLFHLHVFDAQTPIEETLFTLDTLIRAGKIRYTGVSNFSGWHLMKSLGVADRYGYPRHVAHQAYYSLIGRDYEYELMPLALDQGIGTIVWSPLGSARLTGKIRRGQPLPNETRLHKNTKRGPQVLEEYLYKIIDTLDEISIETGKTIPQIAINWILQRPTVSTVIIGARNKEQLKQNLGAIGWKLTTDQVSKLDAISTIKPCYPYWHQHETTSERNPSPV